MAQSNIQVSFEKKSFLSINQFKFQDDNNDSNMQIQFGDVLYISNYQRDAFLACTPQPAEE